MLMLRHYMRTMRRAGYCRAADAMRRDAALPPQLMFIFDAAASEAAADGWLALMPFFAAAASQLMLAFFRCRRYFLRLR
jgi:hypothetical protein